MAEFDIFNLPVSTVMPEIKDYITLIYAPPKFGKTSFVANFGENPLLCAFEKGYNAIAGLRPVLIPDWRFFVKEVLDKLEAAARAGREIPYDVVAIDTTDMAYSMCQDFIRRREGIKHESDLEYGKGWNLVKEEFSKQILRITKLGLGVTFTSHVDEKTIKPKNGEQYNKIVPSMPKGAKEVVLPLCDNIFYGDLKTVQDENGNWYERRVLYCRTTSEFEAGCRLRAMPAEIDFGTDPDEGYANFERIFKDALAKEVEYQNERINRHRAKTRATSSPTEEAKTTKSRAKKQEASEVEPTDKPEDESLDDVIAQLNEMAKNLYTEGKLTSKALVNMVREHCDVAQISDIADIESAKKLMEAFKAVK